MMEPSIPLSHSVTMTQAANVAGFKAGKLDGVVIGLCLAALVGLGFAYLTVTKSTLDVNSSIRLGAIPERTPQERPPTSPVPYQKPMPASSDSGWRGCA
jgi:hypothetical protein